MPTPCEEQEIRPGFVPAHCQWCNEAEGSSVTIGIDTFRWRIRKCLVARQSSFFDRALQASDGPLVLPSDFPGGAAALGAVMSYCLDPTVSVVGCSNVAALRCAAKVLGAGTLSDRAEEFLERVALRTWSGAIALLVQCRSLLPAAEETGIAARCIDSIARIAAADGPEAGDEKMDDLSRSAPACFIGRIIRAMRSKGVSEKSIAQLVMRRSHMCLFDREDDLFKNADDHRNVDPKDHHDAQEQPHEIRIEDQAPDDHGQRHEVQEQSTSSNTVVNGGVPSSSTIVTSRYSTDNVWDTSQRGYVAGCTHEEKVTLLEDMASVLPFDDTLPVNFLFSLLRHAFALETSDDCKSHIEARISLQLENAKFEDLLTLKTVSKDSPLKINMVLDSLMQIISMFLSHHQQQRRIISANISKASQVDNEVIRQQYNHVRALSEIWDEFLEVIAGDTNVSPSKFVQLVEVIPDYARVNHDQLYKAIQVFLKGRTGISPQEHASICHPLNCLKLSQEVCVQAVQDELMPLRMVIQAMFVQQLQTRNAISTHLRAVSGSNGSSPTHLQQGVCMKLDDIYEDAGGVKEPAAASLVVDLQETNLRLQTLEAAMVNMRKSLSTTRLSDFKFGPHNNEKNSEDSVSGSSSGGSGSTNDHNNTSNNTNCNVNDGSIDGSTGRKRRFFLKKSSSTRSRGISRLAKMFQKMGFFGLCKAAPRDKSFKNMPTTEMQPHCSPSQPRDTDGGDFRGKATSSWDDGYHPGSTQKRQHARHHSIA